MSSKHFIGAITVALFATFFIIRNTNAPAPSQTAPREEQREQLANVPSIGSAHFRYTIGDRKVELRDGVTEARIPGSAAIARTLILARSKGDIDGNGTEDAVVVLADDPGGSGTFYYVSALLAKSGKIEDTGAVLLGDRIDLESLVIENGVVVVGIRDRKPNEPIATIPTLPNVLRFKVSGDPPHLAAVN
jgi:hypothetical protein